MPAPDAGHAPRLDRTDARPLWQQQSSSGHLLVAQNAHFRWLEFGDDVAQSAFALADPHALLLPYTQWLLAGLLFTPRAERATVLGFGGGSIATFLARAGVHVTAIDADPMVVDAATRFFPSADHHLDVVVCDAREHLASATSARPADLLLVDLFTNRGMPHWLAHAAFHDACAASLAAGGVVALNLAVDCAAALDEVLDALGAAYGNQALAVAVPEHANVIAIAVNGAHPDAWATLAARAAVLEARFALPFERMLRALFATHGTRGTLRFGATAAQLGLPATQR